MRCCVPFCTNRTRKSTGSPVPFHRFPASADSSRLWLVAMNHRLAAAEPFSRATVRNLRVCGQHFSPDDYREGLQRDILKPTAVPSRCLPVTAVKTDPEVRAVYFPSRFVVVGLARSPAGTGSRYLKRIDSSNTRSSAPGVVFTFKRPTEHTENGHLNCLAKVMSPCRGRHY
ncbi:hypothetical protein AOLI_G00298340 [Acnodon oligacanthus]